MITKMSKMTIFKFGSKFYRNLEKKIETKIIHDENGFDACTICFAILTNPNNQMVI